MAHSRIVRALRVVAVAAGLTAALASAGVAGAAPVKEATGGPVLTGTNCTGGNHCVFWTDFGSAKNSYFNGDGNFAGDVFDEGGTAGRGASTDNNVWSASNSSTGGFYSFYHYLPNSGGGVVFCVSPGSQVAHTQLSTDSIAGNGVGQRDEASSLRLSRTGSAACF